MHKYVNHIIWGSLAAAALVASSASAATLTFHSTSPTPSGSDIYSFSGADHDALNVSDGAAYDDGPANDAFTYVAGDRVSQGQTFTTGTDTNGYTLNSVWLQHAGYTNNTALTWWQMSGGVTLTVRVTDPALAGTAAFALNTDAYITTGNEGWASVQNSTNGSGAWLQFSFASPVTLEPNHTYGFDVTSAGTSAFFEWLGTSDNAFAGGAAYSGSTVGAADDAMNTLVGDRVFLVELAVGGSTNPPATNAPLAAPLTSADPFPNERVQLLDSRFNQNRELHRTGYLAWLDPDRLLYPFRDNAGLPQASGATHLGGWEGGSGFTAVRGHMAGHYLSAASRMYADTGDTNFLTKINYLVTELRKCQDALAVSEMAAGRPYGYLSAFPSTYFDTLETNPTSAQVPFYTVHKILAGLVDAYRYTTNDLALDMAIAMSDYHSWRVTRLSSSQIEAMFRTDNGNTEEWGGMNEALTDLYQVSLARGDADAERHLTFAQVFHRDWFITPLSNDQDQLNGLHANTHVPEVTGFARVASMLSLNDPERDRLYLAASNFWNIVLNQHSFVLGGNSYAEHFSTPGKETGPGGSALAWNTAETCNTHNMLRLTSQLFMHDPSAAYADYYEHALYNHILASIEPDEGMTTYFVPMNSGHFKTYCKPEGSCWCCTGTGIENPARYNEAIYFHKDDVLWVNLFIPSVLDWSERGLTVRLDTAFPATNTVKLTMQCAQPTNAAVRIRIPSWITATPTVKLNGTDQGLNPAAGTFLELNRTWANGDIVEITLPMGLSVDHAMDDPTQVSIFYGPILLAGELGTNGMPASDEAQDQWDYSGVPVVPSPSLIGDNADDPSNWVASDGTALGFNATCAYSGDANRSLIHLVPFYDVHHERYAVYWNLVAPASVCDWTGGGGSADWSAPANWNVTPTSQSAVRFGLPAGGTTLNDLTAGTQINGIRFSSTAGGFVLNGNGIVLSGDVVNGSPNAQSINLPIQLNDGISWALDAAAGDLTLGGAVSGLGVLNKQGTNTLTVLSDFGFSGSTHVSDGQLRIGNGGTTGSLGGTAVILDAGASVAFDRADTFQVGSAISGGGAVIKRGSGTMQLVSESGNTGPTLVEAGTLQIASQSVQALAHRWSFNGDLNDSIGSTDATIVNVGANNTSLTSSSIALTGGSRSASDYVALGSDLLPKDGSPVTIEFWATQLSAQNWSRIFDIGASTSENLFMSWSQGTDVNADRVEWKDAVTTTADNSVAPYTVGTEYHIVMVIEPGSGNNGNTRVTWYAAPSADASLGAAKGSFDTANTLAALDDSNFWLGRSEYGNDATANARYNEVRLWNRALSQAELKQLHALGPDSVGSLATQTTTGSLCAQSDLKILAGAQLDLAGTAQQVASLAGETGAEVQFNGGQLVLSDTGNPTATFAGTLSGSGGLTVGGTLRLVDNATLSTGIVLTNNGTLDIMTWSGHLPVGFVNHGTVLDHSAVKVDTFSLTNGAIEIGIHAYRGHSYQLQYREELATGTWQNVGDAVAGNDETIGFSQPVTGKCGFYRLAVGP